MSTFQRVKEFHKAFGIPHADKTEDELLDGRINLIWEEFQEVLDAAGYAISSDGMFAELKLERVGGMEAPEHFLKELADLDYVVAGTSEVFKWDFDEAGRRVHESNMGKVWEDGAVHYREDGKVLKPNTYQPPELKDLV